MYRVYICDEKNKAAKDATPSFPTSSSALQGYSATLIS
jgi:hypothetical protein